MNIAPSIWFPTIRTGTGTDVFTERLVAGLEKAGLRAEIAWLPLRAEYAPWTVLIPPAPPWATICHVNTWLHPRFIPRHLPVVATIHHSIHDPDLHPHKGALRSAYHKYWIAPIERRILKRSNKIVAVSQFVAQVARETLCSKEMHVIYNGIDTRHFYPAQKTRHNTSKGTFKLLYVGSWISRKGVDLLPSIMSELGDDFELDYTGGAEDKRNKVRISTNMHNIGRLTEHQVADAMRGADALLFPSRSEGFGLVAAEAMACGLPVIASRCSSLPEIITDQVDGILCQKDDVHAMVNAIKKLAHDTEFYKKVSQQAVDKVTSIFSYNKMIDSYCTIYNSII